MKGNGTVILVDDDVDLLKINYTFLQKEGYTIHAYSNPLKAFQEIEKTKPDCIVLDRMMPQLNGMDFCHKVKATMNIPIIMLTGMVTEDDKIDGLLGGADDYLTKPYSLRELSARIYTQIRRSSKTKDGNVVSYPPLTIHKTEHKVYYQETLIPLSNREYDLLYLLVSVPGSIFTFEDIGKQLMGNYMDADRRTIMVNASRLRKKLEEYTGFDNIIETVWSKGYKYMVPHS